MPAEVDRQPLSQGAETRDNYAEQRQILALDTLSKLAKQFSKRPHFGQLAELLVLTLSGQFSVPNICALMRQPGTRSLVPLLYATGKFRNDKLLLALELTDEICEYFIQHDTPADVSRLTSEGGTANVGFILSECGVRVIVPLVHNDSLLGLIGLGERIGGKPFDESDVELLGTLVNTITPFLSSSYLFLEMAGLNTWYLDILNSVDQGVFVFDPHFRLQKINTTGFDLIRTFKPSLQHFSALHRVPIELIFPDAVFSDWTKRFKQVMKNPQSMFLENLVAADGSCTRIYNAHINRVSSNSPLDASSVITIDDVTGQRENEQRLFELRKLADMGAMVSSISHELNNFLGLIQGGVEMTQVAIRKGDTDKVTDYLKRLRGNISQMERFTDGLMDYTKVATLKKNCSLNDIIADVLVHVTAQENFRRIRLRSDLDAGLPEFALDSAEISQLLLNLLNNAADAVNEAGRAVGEVLVRTTACDMSVILSVSDNGTGIRPEVKSKLFRSHMTTKEHGHGHGLVTCAKILENHGAEATIDTEPGRGTTFNLRFPLSEADQ